MAARLNLVVIRSAEIEAAARFYELLGLRFTLHSHGGGPAHYACEEAGCLFEIYPLAPGETPTTSTRIGFEVESVDRAFDRLIGGGASMVSKPKASPWGYRAVVADRDGHRVELVSHSV